MDAIVIGLIHLLRMLLAFLLCYKIRAHKRKAMKKVMSPLPKKSRLYRKFISQCLESVFGSQGKSGQNDTKYEIYFIHHRIFATKYTHARQPNRCTSEPPLHLSIHIPLHRERKLYIPRQT